MIYGDSEQRLEPLPPPKRAARRGDRRALWRGGRGTRAAAQRRVGHGDAAGMLGDARVVPPGQGDRSVMANALRLTLACWDYDRTRALIDGSVAPDGIDLVYLNQPVEETFFRMLRYREFDCSEMSLSSYCASLHSGQSAVHRHPGVPVALLPPFVHLRLGEERHPRAGGPEGQAHRRARVPDDRAGVDPRHPVRRLRRQGHRRASTSPAARKSPAATRS